MSKSSEISSFLQNFIYLMNEESVRDTIIREFCKQCQKNIAYIGTFYVEGKKHNFKDMSKNRALAATLVPPLKKAKGDKNIHFTICYSYDTSSVHYVTFIFMSGKNELIHFDPGISMYNHGQKTIVPTIVKLLQDKKLIQENQEVGTCAHFLWKGKKTGVQFNNQVHFSCPRDAFCQTWTIFFIYQASKSKTFRFVKKWCDIPPEDRENFLLKKFIIPLLQYFPRYYEKIRSKSPPEDYLTLLKAM